MMSPEVMRAQADTLNEWSTLWLRKALIDQGEGSGEVGYQLARMARLVRQIAGEPSAEPVEEAPVPDDKLIVGKLREG